MNFLFRLAFVCACAALGLSLPAYAELSVAMKAIERGHYATAQKALRKPAAEGDATAQNNLAYLYEYGLGVEQSYTEALGWYRRAADAGAAGNDTCKSRRSGRAC